MNSNFDKYRAIFFKSFALIAKLAALDQISKWYLISYLKHKPGYMVEVTKFFNLVYVWNYGISFGLFSNYYQYSNYFFLGANSLILLYIYYLLICSTNMRQFWAYSLICAGAIGNLIDRFKRGAVFDFLDFHIGLNHFAAFNLADSFISIAVLILIYDYFKYKDLVAKVAEEKYDIKYYISKKLENKNQQRQK